MAWIGHHAQAIEQATAALGKPGLSIEGRLDLKPLISQTLPFTRYAEAVDLLRRKQAIKILFDPWL